MPDPNYQHFDYTFTDAYFTNNGLAAVVTTDRDPVVTQLFYYTNRMHDYLYGLGFNEAAGNFQVNNGRTAASGTTPSRPRRTTVLTPAWRSTARTSTRTTRSAGTTRTSARNYGSRAQMQMYLFTNGPSPGATATWTAT